MTINNPKWPSRHWFILVLTWLSYVGLATETFAAATPPKAIANEAIGQHNSVILLYHHVSESTPKSTSVSPTVFAQHMAYLDKHHVVIPLSQAINALQQGEALPDKSVVITFDDGYANILHNAHPILAKFGFPYTVFINPQEIGSNGQQLTWDQVTAMHNDGVSFANHTLDHLHMLDNSQTDKKWLTRVWDNVKAAEDSLASQIGQSHKYLAYPFGEFNLALANKVSASGYIGFGQHSGAIGPLSDFRALPRFPAAGPYANLTTLKTKLNSLAMPVVDSTLSNPEVTPEAPLAPVTLTISSTDVNLAQARCFFAGDAVKTDVTNRQLTFTVDSALPVGRSRVNCTAPSNAHPGRFYWYSQPFFVADKSGLYPN